jgi:hypothetical protein
MYQRLLLPCSPMHLRLAARTHVHQRLPPYASSPAAPRAREPALFRAVHDDGDEEDLEETEARAPIATHLTCLLPSYTPLSTPFALPLRRAKVSPTTRNCCGLRATVPGAAEQLSG